MIYLARTLLWGFFFLSLTSLIACLSGVGFGEERAARAFLAFGLLAFFISMGGLWFSRDIKQALNIRQALLVIVVGWLVLPLFAAIPLSMAGVTHGVRAVFESVSAMTTTGATTLSPETLPHSVMLWLSMLQYLGGWASVTMAILVFSAINADGPGLYRSSLFTIGQEGVLTRFTEVGRAIALILAGASGLVFLTLFLSGMKAFDAVIFSFSAPVTGGISPRTGPLGVWVSDFGLFILAFACVFGALNFARYWDALHVRKHVASLWHNFETQTFLIIIVISTCLGMALDPYIQLNTLFLTFIESASFLSTSAYNFSESGFDYLPDSLKLVMVLIGGSALSTAGGIKLVRLLLTLRYSSVEIARVARPASVVPLSFRGKVLDGYALIALWTYFMAYMLILASMIILTTLWDVDFVNAVVASLASISNAGPVFSQVTTSLYSNFPEGALLVLAGGMILGRLEILAVFAIFLPSFWRH